MEDQGIFQNQDSWHPQEVEKTYHRKQNRDFNAKHIDLVIAIFKSAV